ncbi:MAG TPA: hypothetical protein VFO06_02570 [Gemmatimonadales bacterium]|nr:hypothetical protein [Gemmatimonadales bacterium]
MNRHLLPLAVVLATGLACSDIATPARDEPYEWRLVVGTDTLSFHWPREMLPVRIWVEDSLDMPAHVEHGIGIWRDAFLYGEYDAVLVEDSTDADVLVRVLTPPPKAVATAARALTAFPGCEGATDIDTAATRFQLQLPVRMYVYPKFDPALVDLSECFEITATHEIGHSLGIFRHTGDPIDMMFADPEATVLSERDRQTAEVLSHYPPNMVPVR